LESLKRIGRILFFYFAVPFAVLLILFLTADDIIMPLFTRHGDEFPLPELVGKTEYEVQDIVDKYDLKLEIAGREFSSEQPEGVILTQIPIAGTMVKSGRSIKVVISSGLRTAEVPEVVGLPLQQANLALQKAGFTVGDIYWTRVDTLKEGIALATIPSPGTILPLGSNVSLEVSQGANNNVISMPQLIGMPLERARQKLESVGLALKDVFQVQDTLYLPNTVLDQEPKRGTSLVKGDSVSLVVSRTD
jgi:serine/threonine-protein kinase